MARIIIIGAGECGVRAAFALREKGFEGEITLLGAETDLPYERPPLSKGKSSQPKPIRMPETYGDADIDLRCGTTADAIDTGKKQVTLRDGTTLGYDKLLLATGARARLFPGMDGCLTLRTKADADRIVAQFRPGQNIGIIGGGFIGLELAATARLAGADVTVVEAAEQLMARAVPAEIATVARQRHEAAGVKIRTGLQVASAGSDHITLEDGTRLTFDLVIAGVGSFPNTELAESAGIGVRNGILVDAALRTSAADVFAAGDCCNFPWNGAQVRLESWRAAQDQGAHVAASMLGATDDYAKVPWFWSDQYDLSLQVTGLFDPRGEALRRPLADDAFILFQRSPEGQLIAAAGVGPGNSVAKHISLAEKLIERGLSVDAKVLCDPTINLKSLLRAT
jgi:3-phenylpropionate/trans-cinnamate dioxygenase ferredoxin reductase subunit